MYNWKRDSKARGPFKLGKFLKLNCSCNLIDIALFFALFSSSDWNVGALRRIPMEQYQYTNGTQLRPSIYYRK